MGARFCDACGAPLDGDRGDAREARKTVTVVFSDVVSSTALGERLDPESLRRVMSRYFDEVRTVLDRHGGTVEKFIGDAVMAVFGVPTLHEDDALRAVRAAVEIREALQALNAELERERGVGISARIGISTGEVVVEPLQRRPHAVRRSDGSQRVVLVELWDPEHGHHGVADELLDRALVPFDHLGHLVEVAAHHAAERFRVQPLPEGRGARDVREHDRHDPANVGGDTLGLAERRRAVLAEASLVGVLFSAGRAPLHGRILEVPGPRRNDHVTVPMPVAS